jgi:hypothetical protein
MAIPKASLFVLLLRSKHIKRPMAVRAAVAAVVKNRPQTFHENASKVASFIGSDPNRGA